MNKINRFLKLRTNFFFFFFLFFLVYTGANIEAKETSNNLKFENTKAQSLMRYLPDIFHDKKIAIFSQQSSPEEELALVFLIKSSKINSLNYGLVDLPIKISKEIIKISKLFSISSISELLGEIEKISTNLAKEKILSFLLQHEIQIAGGAINYPYKDKDNETQEFYIQYLLTFYPDRNKEDGSVIINFYSNKIANPHILGISIGGMTTENYSEKMDPLDPFIATVSGKVKKGYLNLYEWEDSPSVEITFPEEVPDLGIKPLSFWERQILEPIFKIKNDIQFFVKKTMNIDLDLDKIKEVVINIFDKIKNVFTKNKPNLSASLVDNSSEINGESFFVEKEPEEHKFIVKRIIDGDTIELENGETIRFLGIDTPEKGECLYSEAKNININLLEGKKISLIKEDNDKDIYGRLLRYVYIDSLFINDYLIEQGFSQLKPSESFISHL